MERVLEGGSTYVYRFRSMTETFYARIMKEEESFAIEVKIHEMLIKSGVQVPKVVCFEHKNELLGLSFMIVEEIEGSCMESMSEKKDFEHILHQAGKQIALVNQIKVDGFGWVNRKVHHDLIGESDSFRGFYDELITTVISGLPQSGFTDTEMKVINDSLEMVFSNMNDTDAYLVHGDFDLTHIFCNKGRYTGIIDFGEIMGNSRFYDLAHFRFHTDFPKGINGMDALLNGYREIYKLTEKDIFDIDLLALFFGVWKLGKTLSRPNLYKYFLGKTKTQLERLR
nr:aminoglycoside phosphotransferase family protein [Paenibacillus castaneae]